MTRLWLAEGQQAGWRLGTEVVAVVVLTVGSVWQVRMLLGSLRRRWRPAAAVRSGCMG